MVRSLTVIRCVVHTFKTAPSVNRPTAHLAVIAIASFRYPMECEARLPVLAHSGIACEGNSCRS
jgi:hypothetical protein